MVKSIKDLYAEIKQKCNPNSDRYRDSIICEEWKIYKNFEEWCLENGWDKSKTIYTETNYTPEDCCIMDSREASHKTIQRLTLKKYGVSHYSKTQEYKDKCKSTCLDRYGETHYMKNKDCYNEYKQSNINKYGVENQFQRIEIIEKSKKTMIKK